MSTDGKTSAVRSVSRGVEETSPAPASAGAGVERLEAFIGNWINQGTTVASPEHPGQRIVTSDVYEWAPGGHFVVHTAYGLIGDTEVGGIEVIGPGGDEDTFISHFHDSFGNTSTSEVAYGDGQWHWRGDGTRCRAEISADGKVQTAHHERLDADEVWRPSMEVVLRRVD
jgi:hypothetical protein